jgi:hypothetical protein
LPPDPGAAPSSRPKALASWEDITPLARNEWICWVESAKRSETRSKRIGWGCENLEDGKRRPIDPAPFGRPQRSGLATANVPSKTDYKM